MAPLRRLSRLLRNLFRKSRVEDDLADEVQACVNLLSDEKIAAGIEPAAARRAALIELGGVEQVTEQVRAVRAGALVDQLWRDARYAARTLRKSPGFTLVAVLTLALGIGLNTALFTAFDAVALRPLPVAEPESVVRVERWFESGARGNIQLYFSH